MRIDGPGHANAAGSGSGARRTDAASTFTLPSDPGRARTAAVSTPGGTYDVAALMALQSVEGPLEKRRKAVRRGFDLLDTLDDIRIDLLSGTMPPERLERLVELLGQTSGPTMRASMHSSGTSNCAPESNSPSGAAIPTERRRLSTVAAGFSATSRFHAIDIEPTL